MNDDLTQFLATADLDDLAEARELVTAITREDAQALSDVVGAGTDEQAMANLLMYPELIPPPLRIPTLLGALDRSETDYRVLAAVIGVRRADIDETDALPVGDRLLELATRGSALLAAEAARSFGKVADVYDVRRAVQHLGEMHGTARHNLVAELVHALGTAKIQRALAAAGTDGSMRPDDIQMIEDRLHEIEQNPRSPLNVSLLSYIPNLEDWNSSAD